MSDASTTHSTSRTLSGLDFFWLWAGAAIALSEIWAGGLLSPQGLALGLAAILLGHVFGCAALVGAGWIGSERDVPAIVSTRPALGHFGAALAGVLNVVQLLGWTAVMIWIAGAAMAHLPAISSIGERGWVLIIGAITTLWAAGGRTVWRPLQRIAVALLVILSVIMTWKVLRAYPIRDLWSARPNSDAPFLLALDAVIVMPISWLPLVADYSRYARNTRKMAGGTFWGYFIGSSWMYAVGLIASLATQSESPDTMVIELLGTSHLAIAALGIILLSTFTTTFLDIFSAAISAQSLWPKLPERATTVAVGLIGTALALFFDASTYEPFLSFIGSAFCPLFGIVLADYFILRRRATDPAPRARWRAIAVWLLGFAAYQAITIQKWPIGASLPSFLGAGCLYAMISRRKSS